MYSAYWRRSPHYDSPACFSCSIVSFEGRGFFSCVSVFFNFDLSNFSISAISGLSDMVAGRSRASCANEESLICSEAAAGLGTSRWAEPGRGNAPRLGSGGEEPRPCRFPRALNSPELGQSLAFLPASVASLNSRGHLSSALGG